MRNSNPLTATGCTLLGLVLFSGVVSAQQDDVQSAAETAENAGPPEIPDEPKTVDPATLMPERLAEAVTVDFSDSSIGEVAEWIREEHQFPVLLDERNLADINILVSDPVSDRLDDEPLYLLLNRIGGEMLDWYVEDDILWITTTEVAAERLTTEQYLIGDLLDLEYEQENLISVIANETAGPWFDVDGIGGSIEVLGDVMFVRHTAPMQREVSGLLAALRRHARMTFTLDPPQHMQLREKLTRNVEADFDDTPLVVAIRALAEQADVDVHLDPMALKDAGVRDRQPVSLALSDRPLSTVLQVLLSPHNLTWILRDGVLWITTTEIAEHEFKTAVFDVTDLCPDRDVSDALQEAIQEQTSGPWFDTDGSGGTITFAKPGAMVIRCTERKLYEVLELLEMYREALRLSRPREREGVDPNEFITTYYRVEAAVADDLASYLPLLVRQDSWRSDEAPDAEGSILQVTSTSDFRETHIVAQAVLIIHQSRAAHEEISEIIRRVEQGDSFVESGGGFGGGGGFFSTE